MLGKMLANVCILAAIFHKIWRHIEFLGIYEKGNSGMKDRGDSISREISNQHNLKYWEIKT